MLLLSGRGHRSCHGEEFARVFRGYDSSDLSGTAGFLLVTCHVSLFTSFPLALNGNLNDNIMVDLKMSRFKR